MMNTIHSCGIKIDLLSVNEISAIVNSSLEKGRKGFHLTGINIEQIALINKNKEFKDYINSSDIVNIDGTAVSLFLRLRGYKESKRALCADIFLNMLKTANEKKQRVYFLGASEDVILKLVKNIHDKYPNINITGFHNGYFNDESQIVSEISKTNSDYLFIGMPSPFKERFITTYKHNLNVGVCYGVGGMFDILAGKVNRAPAKIQKMGLEWLYRISQNPIGHSKRVLKALIPCLLVFLNDLFIKRPTDN